MPLKLCTEKVGHYLADLRLSDAFCKASFVTLLHPLDPITTPDDTETSIFFSNKYLLTHILLQNC